MNYLIGGVERLWFSNIQISLYFDINKADNVYNYIFQMYSIIGIEFKVVNSHMHKVMAY